MNTITISGYYGYDNLGDEAILASILYGLRKQDREIDLTVFSINPEKTKQEYAVKAVNRNNYKQVFQAIKNSDIFLSGGGSLLQDVTSWRSIPFYLGQVFLAQLLGKKSVLYAQGIGPVNGKLGRSLIRKIVKKTDLITVRDMPSKQLLSQLGINEQRIIVTADPVFLLKKKEWSKGAGLLAKAGIMQGQRLIGVSVRSWGDDQYIKELAPAVQRLADLLQAKLIIIPLHYQQDIPISQELRDLLGDAEIITEQYGPLEMLEIFAELDFLVGVRFHSLLFAAIHNCPFVAINYDPKIDGFLNLLAVNSQVAIKELDGDTLFRIAESVWQNKESFIKILDDRGRLFYELAAKNIEILLSICDN